MNIVSLEEIFEIRDDGFTSNELLSLLISITEYALIDNPKKLVGLFSPKSVYLTPKGKVVVHFTSLKETPLDFIPPELHNTNDNYADIGDPQMIWCSGEIASRASLPSFSDVGIFSLINLMTVEHVGSRPTPIKLLQMLRNKIYNINDVQKTLQHIYRELMGDIDELIDDKFCDDIRFSSTRSSLSIISGPKNMPEDDLTNIESNLKDEHSHLNLSDKDISIPNNLNDILKIKNLLKQNSIDKNTDENLNNFEHSSNPFFGETNNNYKNENFSSQNLSNNITEDFADNAKHITNCNSLPKNQLSENLFTDYGQTNLSFEDYPTENNEENLLKKMDEVYIKTIKDDVHTYQPPTPIHQHKPSEKIVSARHFTKRINNNEGPVLRNASHIYQQHNSKESCISSNSEIEVFEQIIIPSNFDSSISEEQQSIKKIPEKIILPLSSDLQSQQNFSRQNSLQSTKIQRRLSTSLKNLSPGINLENNRQIFPASTSSVALPEFLEKNNMPMIRLRAQRMKRKKVVNLHRGAENAMVLVKLLNGQTVEVKCCTNAYASDIFETVAAHLNLSEHLFFGLAVIQNSEYIFMDSDDRLEKFAPNGWKNGTKKGRENEFILHLRFRYYPKKLEFIRTENTTHNLYLQLRQDMLNASIRFLPNKAFDLAAIALQAEFLDRKPLILINNNFENNSQYFKLENYLPSKFYFFEDESPSVTSARLADLHLKYSGLVRAEAERLYIQRCQTELGYGAHYYKVYKIKPSIKSPYYNRYSDAHLIAIMPHGIGICREQTGGQRYITTTHEWHMIRTLQFDRKRFLIATIENNIAVDYIFYTEHYSKTRFLVRFAATQHRFMMKMRHWQSTLNRVKTSGDVGVDGMFINDVCVDDPHYNNSNDKTSLNSMERSVDTFKDSKKEISEIDTSYIQYCYGSEAMKLTVVLEKHPKHGLGLTLVDGSVNGVKGVYVKSVSLDGDGRKKGVHIGDCLLSVNGTSLFNKSRHDAVELVKDCDLEVRLEVLRFPSITEVLAQDPSINDYLTNLQNPTKKLSADSKEEGENRKLKSKLLIVERKVIVRSDILEKSVSRKASNYNSNRSLRKSSVLSSAKSQQNNQKQQYQRTVSDFGAIGDTLPVLNSDDLLMSTLAKDGSSSSSSGAENNDENGLNESGNGVAEQRRKGEYNLPAVSAMYNLDGEDYDEDYKRNLMDASSIGQKTVSKDSRPFTQHKSQVGNLISDEEFDTMSWNSSHYSVKTAFDTTTLSSQIKQKRQKNNLDWTNELSDIEDGQQTPPSSKFGTSKRRHENSLTTITKNFKVDVKRSVSGQNLGFQIATTTIDNVGVILVKKINDEPALSANLQINDIILAINGISIIGYTHQEVVNLLKTQQFNVVLDVQRTTTNHKLRGVKSSNSENNLKNKEETITVVLDKSKCKIIGLSLAKRMGQEGIFIRKIAESSLAEQEGSLRVGDRIWEIDGENVSEESPANIVKRLKDIDEKFQVCIKRTKTYRALIN